MHIFHEIKKIWNWLFAKRSEIAQLGYKDAFMARIVMEILQSKNHAFQFIPLYQLDPIHPVDNRENALVATHKRAKKLTPSKREILNKQKLSKEYLAEILPSATYMRAVPMENNRCVTFEGNGRIAALKEVFSPEDHIEIELEIFKPKHARRIRKKIKKLRAMHGMA